MSNIFDTTYAEQCALSRIRNTWVKIQLLDSSYNAIDTLEGICTESSIIMQNNIGDNNIQEYSSFNRLSGSITFVLTKTLATNYFEDAPNSRIRIVAIVEDVPTEIVTEYNLGICIIGSSTITRSANSSDGCTIQLELLDLFSLYNGDLGGSLESQYSISASSDSPVTLVTLLNTIFLDMGLTNDYISIESNLLTIQQDITADVGSNYTDILKTIMELYLGYELFFDRDGILTYRKIKSRTSDSTIRDMVDDDTITSYKYTKKDTNIRNYIIIYGATSTSSDTDETTYQYNAYASLQGTNHPFSVDNIGRRIKTISDETQSNYAYCLSEAEYYLDLYTNYAESVEISMLPDFRLIPNRVISIIYEDDYIPSGVINGKFLINSVNFSLKQGDLATITVTKLYDTVINSTDIITGKVS